MRAAEPGLSARDPSKPATADGYRVRIVDQRYARPGGFGTATVFLTEDLRPVGVEVN